MKKDSPNLEKIPAPAGSKRLPVDKSALLQILMETVRDYAIILLDKEGKVPPPKSA